MGEVRVRVRLTNAVDQAPVRQGLLQPEQVRIYEADALVGTGAVRCWSPRMLFSAWACKGRTACGGMRRRSA